MTDSDISNDGEQVTERYHETDFHGSRVEEGSRHEDLLQESVEIDGEEWTLWNVVEVERLRRRYSREYRTLMESLNDTTRRGVVAALVRNGSATYRDLSEWVSTTTRTVKTHVHALRDENIVEVVDGRPALVTFRDDDLRLLASDVLSFS